MKRLIGTSWGRCPLSVNVRAEASDSPADINTYVETRLTEGASGATIRLELSAVRGLFQFAMDMGASDVFFNPTKNVRVRKPESGSLPGIGGGEATESQA
ncbi:MAG: site-specific integrase [Candidatus Sulfotelmatobacter sp.]